MALVTNIQRYSVHDGNGIRTTVFFKGCPLKCQWCHNPETQSFQKQLLTNTEQCTGCMACKEVCASGAISMKNGKAVTNPEQCTVCGTCIKACCNNLREIAGKDYTVSELFTELKKDELFFEQSGGGVTLSGGEVMCMDMDFIEALLKRLCRYGISVNIDTCGFAPYENFQRILPYIDTFLYDVKALDNERHKQWVGVDNTLILENLKRLSQDGAKLFIRIPTIQGVNADRESMTAIIDWLKQNHIKAARVNLLPYHNTGSSKYARLEQEYGGVALQTPSKEEMNALEELFRQAGFFC